MDKETRYKIETLTEKMDLVFYSSYIAVYMENVYHVKDINGDLFVSNNEHCVLAWLQGRASV